MNVNINNKWAAAIVFVLLGIFTMLVPTDEEEKEALLYLSAIWMSNQKGNAA